MEEELTAMKRLKEEERYHLNKNRNFDNERDKLRRMLDEKEEAIKKLENKLEEYT